MKKIKATEMVKGKLIVKGEVIWETPYVKSKEEVWDYISKNKLKIQQGMVWVSAVRDEYMGVSGGYPMGQAELTNGTRIDAPLVESLYYYLLELQGISREDNPKWSEGAELVWLTMELRNKKDK